MHRHIAPTYRLPKASIVQTDEGANGGILLGDVISYILVSNESSIYSVDLRTEE